MHKRLYSCFWHSRNSLQSFGKEKKSNVVNNVNLDKNIKSVNNGEDTKVTTNKISKSETKVESKGPIETNPKVQDEAIFKKDYLKGLDFKYVKKMEDVIQFSLS